MPSIGGGKSKSSSTQSFDPAIMDKLNGFIGRETGFADSYKPYDGQINAPTTGAMNNYQGFVSGLGDTGKGLLNSATAGANTALGFAPASITAPTMSAANAGSAQTFDPSGALAMLKNPALGQASTVNRGDIRNVQLGDFGATLPKFLNPATDSIVNAGLADNEHARLVATNYDNAKAGAAGAFGNSGFGVARAGTNDAFQRSAGSLAAQLRGDAYDKAQAGALNYLGMDLQGQTANQGADLGVATTNAGLLSGMSQFNAGQTNNMAGIGAGLLNTAGIFNTGQINSRADADATRLQGANTTNADNALSALQSNQDAGIRGADINLRGAGLMGDLSNDQVDQATKIATTLGAAGSTSQNMAQGDLNRLYQQWQDNWQNMTEAEKLVAQSYGFLPDAKTTTSNSSAFNVSLPVPGGPGG